MPPLFELQMHVWLPRIGGGQVRILQKALAVKDLQSRTLYKAPGARDPNKPRGHIVQVLLVLNESGKFETL